MNLIDKIAVVGGIISAVIELLKVGDEQTVVDLLTVSAHVVVSAPPDQVTATARGLLPTIAALLTASPPVAPGCAADALFGLGFMRRALVKDFHTWGLGESVQQLVKHDDPYTAAAGKRLLFLINEGLEVSLMSTFGLKLCYLLFPCAGQGIIGATLYECEGVLLFTLTANTSLVAFNMEATHIDLSKALVVFLYDCNPAARVYRQTCRVRY